MMRTIVLCIISSIAFGQGMGYGGRGGGMGTRGMMTPKLFDNLNLDDLYGMDFEDFFRYGAMSQPAGGQSGGYGGYGNPYMYGINNLFRNVGQMAANYPGGFAQLYDDLNIDDLLEKGYYGMMGGMGGAGGMGGGNIQPFRFQRRNPNFGRRF